MFEKGYILKKGNRSAVRYTDRTQFIKLKKATFSVTVEDFCVSPVTLAVADLEVKEDLDLLEDTAAACLD